MSAAPPFDPALALQERALPPAPDVLWAGRLSLAAFRNYREVRLTLSPAPVVLTGPNGSGKTNLLEALSLLVPGRGLRRASVADWQNKEVDAPWGFAVELEGPLGGFKIGTGRDPENPLSERRLLRLNDKPLRAQQALAEHVAMAWITPELDRVLSEGASARRKLLDRLVYSFDPAHAGRVHRYDKAMRERLRLLREGPRDPTWLAALEDEQARTGVAIAAARRSLLSALSQGIAETASAFPRANLALAGAAEEALLKKPALLIEDDLRAALCKARADDAAQGTCSIGPHRSDLLVEHQARGCPAALCSTGEQKALLIAIMLAYLRTLTRARAMVPLLLLDDIAAHLDSLRREALFDEIEALQVQAWITGTDKETFRPFLARAQHLTVSHGAIFA